MEHRITIVAGSVTMDAELNDAPTAQRIWESLPITGRAMVWGDEIYFEIPVAVEQAPDARADVEVGELGYWPVGRAFCIFLVLRRLVPVTNHAQPVLLTFLVACWGMPQSFGRCLQGRPLR